MPAKAKKAAVSAEMAAFSCKLSSITNNGLKAHAGAVVRSVNH